MVPDILTTSGYTALTWRGAFFVQGIERNKTQKKKTANSLFTRHRNCAKVRILFNAAANRMIGLLITTFFYSLPVTGGDVIETERVGGKSLRRPQT